MFYNTKQSIERILDIVPEEFSWIDYKAACDFNNEFKVKIKFLVTSFLNSLFQFGNKKYIIFGVEEDNKTKKKYLNGLKTYKFPDDNEWQNLFLDIKPIAPNIETGTLEYKGLLFGYILIYDDNFYVPYYCHKKGKETYYIRRGGNKYDDMTCAEKAELIKKREKIEQEGKIYQKSNILNLLVTLGQYNESHKNDIGFIEDETGKNYAAIKSYCLYIDSSFTQNEKSIYGIGQSETVYVQNKYERLLQFSSDEIVDAMGIIASALRNEDTIFSEELLEGVADTLVFLSNNGFSHYAKKVIRSTINKNSFQNYKYTNFLQQFSEVHPDFILRMISEHKEEFLTQRLYGNNVVVDSLRVIAWFPEYYEEAVKLLIEFKDSAIYELFECADTTTAAGFNQKLALIKEISDTNKELAFKILNKVLYFNPNIIRILSHSYVPERYKRLLKRGHNFNFDQLKKYYRIIIEIVGNDVAKILELLPHWLMPSPFSDLQLLANHIEMVEPTIKSDDDRQKLWNRLCNTPLIYITDSPVNDSLRDRLISIGNKFKPNDLYKQYQQWFRKGIINDLCVDNTKFDDVNKKIFEEQRNVLLKIYECRGINGIIEFIKTVEIDSFKLMKIILSEGFSLSIEDDNALIAAFLDTPQIYSNYFFSKSYCKKLDWIKELNIENLNLKDKAIFFASLNPTIENINYFEEILGEDIKLYWLSFSYRELNEPSAVKYVFENLIQYGMPQKAFEILGFLHVNIMEQLPTEWLFNALLSIEEYQECSIPIYAFASIYSFLCRQLDDNMLERLEILSFKLYKMFSYSHGYEDFKPRVTFKKIVSEPQFFVDLVRDAMDDLLGLSECLLKNCDEEPKMLNNWLEGIGNLVSGESETLKSKIDWWVGHILYNTIESVNDNYLIQSSIAKLLEESENRRQGFLSHAYFPNGFHSNGRYEEDLEDRNNAEKFRHMAEAQNREGNIEFGKSLNAFADELIKGIECQ